MAVYDVPNMGRKKVVVGIRFDGHAEELLDWAVKKVAGPGDSVVAIHVCRNSGCVLAEETATLDGHLQGYQALCRRKQVALSAEVVKGNSVRKVMVGEATEHSASAVILGVTKHSALSGWASVAKYCAKRLPPTTQVMAIYNGKVIFSRFSMLEFKENRLEFGKLEMLDTSSNGRDSTASSGDEDHLSPVGRHNKGCLRTISLPAEDFTKQKPGWPLLQTSTLITRPVQEARKMSVVQWAMKLPRRSVSDVSDHGSSPYPDHYSLASQHDLEHKPAGSCSVFSYDQLKMSTCNFSSGNLIGKGGCNSVYKGIRPDGKPVAVKIMESTKGARKDFMREMEIMTTVQHKRIIPLLGTCTKDNKLISVYEFLSKGSLEENLHNNSNLERCVLPWEVRFHIAIGIAEALNYLHSECSKPVIHRDVKSSNILLTEELEPQLCDFGLAIWGPTSTSSLMDSDVVGTFGYLAPEYFMYGKVSEKIDVYALGVVLLELLSGRKPIGMDNAKGHQESLVMWAKPRLENGDVISILDPKLSGNVDKAQMQKMALAARLCLNRAARLRPRMGEILRILNEEEYRGINYDGSETQDDSESGDEVYPDSSAESHLNVIASLDLNDNSASASASFSSSSSGTDRVSPSLFVENYMKERWSRSSSVE